MTRNGSGTTGSKGAISDPEEALRFGHSRRFDLNLFARTLAGVVVAIALAVLMFGWVFDLDFARRLRPGYAAMVPVTALCLLLLAGGTAFRATKAAPAGTWIVMAAAWITGLIGLLDILALALADDAILTWFGETYTVGDDTMSVASAICAILGAVALSALDDHGQSAKWRLQIAATAGLSITLAALLAYLFDASALYEDFLFSAMALHTALAFALLFTAQLMVRGAEGWMGILLADGRGSARARRLFPIGLIAPTILCLLAYGAANAGVLSRPVIVALFAIVLTALGAFGTLGIAAAENEAERERHGEETRLRRVLDGLQKSVFAITESGQVQFANRSARELSSASGSPTQWLAEAGFFSPLDESPIGEEQRPVARLLRDEPVSDQLVGYRAEGAPARFFRLSTGSFVDANGRTIRLLSFIDVTAEHDARHRAERAERLDVLGQMSGGIAHDFANVLGVIRLSADVGAMSDDPEKMRRQFESIRAACVRGTDLTGRILAFSRQQPGSPQAIALPQFLADVSSLARRTIPSNIRLDTRIDAQDAVVHCEAGPLEASLLNLIFNARDAMVEASQDGTITLALAASDEQVRIVVADNGPGMSPAVMRRATEPFFTTRQGTGGTGLGLTMVDSFARNSGGLLAIRSTIGEGTTIELILPRVEARADAGTRVAVTHDLKGVRILVAEDDALFGDVLASTLEDLGITVLRARTGVEAIEIARSGAEFDLLLTDVIMRGGIDGFRAANEIRQIRPDLPVLYVSAYADANARANYDTEGVNLKKPVSAERLIEEIAKLVGPRPSVEEGR